MAKVTENSTSVLCFLLFTFECFVVASKTIFMQCFRDKHLTNRILKTIIISVNKSVGDIVANLLLDYR